MGNSLAPESEPDVIIFGHTHEPGLEKRSGKVAVNSGAWVGGRGTMLLIDDIGLKLRTCERVGDALREVYSRRVDLR